MKIKYLVFQFIGIMILGVILFQNYYSEKISDQDLELKTTIIGKDISKLPLEVLFSAKNESNKSTRFNSEVLYIVVSPHCIHCRNALSFIQQNKSFFLNGKNMDVKIVFQKKYNNKEVTQFMTENKFDLTIHKSTGTSILDNLNAIPCFIYSKQNKVTNMYVGGVLNLENLKSLINSLRNSEWKRGQSSDNQSACQS